MKRFQVIGKGESDSLRGAQALSAKGSKDKPPIFLSVDCVTVDGKVRPKPGATPAAAWDGKTWEYFCKVFGEM